MTSRQYQAQMLSRKHYTHSLTMQNQAQRLSRVLQELHIGHCMPATFVCPSAAATV